MALERWFKAGQPATLKGDAEVDQVHRAYGPAAIDVVQTTIDAAVRVQDKRRLRRILRLLEADQRHAHAHHDGELFI